MSDNAFGDFFIGDADEDIPARGQGVISVPLVVPDARARTAPSAPVQPATEACQPRGAARRARRASSGWC